MYDSQATLVFGRQRSRRN